MLLYCIFKFKLTQIFLLEQHTGVMLKAQCPFCDINNGVNGNSNYKLIVIFILNRRDVFHQPVMPHISSEAPMIRNEKKFDTIKGKASRNG